jgi:hypothetical protein
MKDILKNLGIDVDKSSKDLSYYDLIAQIRYLNSINDKKRLIKAFYYIILKKYPFECNSEYLHELHNKIYKKYKKMMMMFDPSYEYKDYFGFLSMEDLSDKINQYRLKKIYKAIKKELELIEMYNSILNINFEISQREASTMYVLKGETINHILELPELITL